ncbi:MAG TPA: hypothetical protein VH325_16110 [Bryobacteraceae bacterium]|nr:hypothetical protein [Bryobacteraceae bacterium]
MPAYPQSVGALCGDLERASSGTLWLPDTEKGFYRGTRFDWRAASRTLSTTDTPTLAGGLWYHPAVRDVAWDAKDNGYAAGKASANVGPVEEFTGPA